MSRTENAAQCCVLVMAGKASTGQIRDTCKQMKVYTAANSKQCIKRLEKKKWDFLIVALGIDKSTSIFDEGGSSSSLIEVAKRQSATAIIYSKTACRVPEYKRACFQVGADYVIDTPRELNRILSHSTVGPPPNCFHYAPLKRKAEALHALVNYRQAQGFATSSFQAMQNLDHQILSLSKPLLIGSSELLKVRVVAVSDTHSHHSFLDIPSGDILIHCGDIVGNYGHGSDIKKHFSEFIQWVHKMSTRFRFVVFIAGNHDTLLDGRKYNDVEAKKLLRGLPSNVVYLENCGTKILGINIFGCPFVPCRFELMNKRYFSDGFERKIIERQKLFEKIPEKTDILITHGPPNVPGVSAIGDDMLKQKLDSLKYPPQFHIFGHEHDRFGVYENEKTVFINAAQLDIVRADMKLNSEQRHCCPMSCGIPIEFDCVSRKL